MSRTTEAMVGSGLKITCSREELAQKLAVVGRGVSTRTAVQILSGILVRSAGGVLELAATDMELSIRTTLDARVEGEGAVVVPGRLLVDLSRLLPESEVTIEHREEESVLQVSCGSAQYRLNTYGAEDFPRLPDVSAGSPHTLDADALLETLACVGRAVSRDEARPVLTGILVRFGDGKLVMSATDSYRLSYKERPVEGPSPELEAIVPARALEELRRLIDRRRDDRARRPGEPGRLRRRRHLADHAPHRRPVPEVRRAPAEGVQARGDAAAGGVPRGRPPHVGDGAPQLAAPAALREGEVTDLDADGGRRARPARRCRSGSTANRSRSASTPTSCATGSSPPKRGAPPAPDRSAEAGLDPGRRRRLLVPDHADQARRLIVSTVFLANVRSYARLELALEPGPRAGGRPERRRQDEPARVAARRHAGLLAADALRCRADPLRREARRGSGSRGRAARPRSGRGRPVRRRGQAGGGQRRAAPRGRAAAQRDRDARLHARPARDRQGRPGRPPRVLRPCALPACPGPSAVPTDYAAALAQRNAALKRATGPRSRPGPAQVAALGRSLVESRLRPRAARSVLRHGCGRAGLDRRPALVRGRTADDGSARIEARPRSRAWLHRPGPAPRRRLDRRRRARPALVRLARANSAPQSSRSSSPRRRFSPSGVKRRRCSCSTTFSRSSISAAGGCWSSTWRAGDRR